MKKIFLPAMLALLLLTAGCEQPPNNPPEKPVTTPADKPDKTPPVKPTPDKPSKPAENPPPKNQEHALDVKVYYPDDSGMKLVEVRREIFVGDDSEKYSAAIEVLRKDPVEANLTKIFPDNAAINSVTVENGLATVDFDGGILKGFVGGSTGEEFLIGSIVNTLTNFPEVTGVKFLVDGKEIETLSGHMDLSTPLERMDSLID